MDWVKLSLALKQHQNHTNNLKIEPNLILVITVKIVEVASYSNLKPLYGNIVRNDKSFKLHFKLI